MKRKDEDEDEDARKPNMLVAGLSINPSHPASAGGLGLVFLASTCFSPGTSCHADPMGTFAD